TFLEFVGMTQLGGVVTIERDDERTLVAIVHRDAARCCQLAGEIGPEALAFERQRQERLFAGLGLDRSREHAGRGPTGAMPGLAAIVNRDGAASPRQPPSNTHAAHPRPPPH